MHPSSLRSRRTPRTATAIAIGIFWLLPGCGSSIDQILFSSGTAVGRTILDQLLTDIANALAERQEDMDTEGGDDGDGGNGDGDGNGNGGGLDDRTGDPAAGQAVYENNGCAPCHCADAAGGCALSAPALIGVDRNVLDDFLRGAAAHPSKPDLSDQQIVDLEAYLASL